MVDDICAFISRKANLSEEQYEVIKFGLESLISTLFSFFSTFLLSWIFGVWKIMLIVMVSFAAIKVTAGGTHCKSMLNCAIFSSLSFTFIAKLIAENKEFLIAYQNSILFVITLFTYSCHYMWAPAQVPEKPISVQYRKKLRHFSFMTLTVAFVFLYLLLLFRSNYTFPIVSASSFGILWHTITITPFGYWLFRNVDSILFWIQSKGGVLK